MRTQSSSRARRCPQPGVGWVNEWTSEWMTWYVCYLSWKDAPFHADQKTHLLMWLQGPMKISSTVKTSRVEDGVLQKCPCFFSIHSELPCPHPTQDSPQISPSGHPRAPVRTDIQHLSPTHHHWVLVIPHTQISLFWLWLLILAIIISCLAYYRVLDLSICSGRVIIL